MTQQFWMNLQTRYDLEVAEDNLADRLDKEAQTYQAA
jgi:plasmid maintenance system antidote protein VapI